MIHPAVSFSHGQLQGQPRAVTSFASRYGLSRVKPNPDKVYNMPHVRSRVAGVLVRALPRAFSVYTQH